MLRAYFFRESHTVNLAAQKQCVCESVEYLL